MPAQPGIEADPERRTTLPGPRTHAVVRTGGDLPVQLRPVADWLEAAGFVERVRDPGDRRRWELRPLPGRQDEIAALFAPLAEAMPELCAGYGDAELDLLTYFLAKLGGDMADQTVRLRR